MTTSQVPGAEVAMRGWVSVSILALVLLAGCGSSGGGKSTSTSAQQATAHASSASAPPGLVARTFLAAAKSGHGGVACSLMTAKAVSNLARYVEATVQGKSNRADDCARYFSAFQTSGGGTLPSLKIGPVTVSGETAKAAVVCGPCRSKVFPALRLRRTAAGWRVDYDYRRGY